MVFNMSITGFSKEIKETQVLSSVKVAYLSNL